MMPRLWLWLACAATIVIQYMSHPRAFIINICLVIYIYIYDDDGWAATNSPGSTTLVPSILVLRSRGRIHIYIYIVTYIYMYIYIFLSDRHDHDADHDGAAELRRRL